MKIFKRLGITICSVILGCFIYTKIDRFLKIDSCLDKGRRWDYSLEKCECSDSSLIEKLGLPKSRKNDHLIIRNKCAVIFNPDSVKISQAKKNDEESFYVSADDAMYYISQSRDFFRSKQIQIVETDSRIIDFKVDDKLIRSINLNTDNQLWGILLFDGKNIPVKIDYDRY